MREARAFSHEDGTPSRPLGPIALIRGAAELGRQQLGPLLGLWATMSALEFLANLPVALRSATNGMVAVTNGDMLLRILMPFVLAGLGAWVLKLVLRDSDSEPSNFRFWPYLLLIGGLGAVQTIAVTEAFNAGLATNYAYIALRYGVTLVAAVFALWPIGLLLGGPAGSPFRAVGAMRRAYLGFVIAGVLLGIAPFLGQLISGLMSRELPRLLLAGVAATLEPTQICIWLLLAAEVYRIRFLAHQDVGRVFS